MAHIAVVFGTTDGQTAKIARQVAEVLRSEQDQVELIDTRAPIPAAPFEGVEAAVIAGSVRMGKFQRPLVAFARAHQTELARIPTAFLPVSLSAARSTPAAVREVRKTIARFIEETGFTPGFIQPLAGALVYSRYPFFTRLAMKLISKMAGGDTDTSRDYEYTDWNAVSDFARRFAVRARQAPAEAPPASQGGWRADASI
jgi:menaquinone-dependent protoporphyrinogen oxidase